MEINNSKEVIKNRMLRHALNYWSVKNTEDLDPAVKLIMEALSSELYNLGNEIIDAQARILEKIASLLTPDFLTAPNPAHAVMHATSIEPVEQLTSTTSFVAQGKVSSKQNEILDTTLDFFFTPVDTVQVTDARVAYLVTGGTLFSYNPYYTKQVLARSRKGKVADNNTIWVGLRISPKIEALDFLSFYFDLKNVEPNLAYQVYPLLSLAKWYLEDRDLQIKPGIQYIKQSKTTDTFEDIFLEYDLRALIEKDIKQLYHQKFITVTDQQLQRIQEFKKPHPEAFKDFFSDGELQGLKEEVVWFKITFPAAIHPDFLSEFYVYLNAFPVVNRQLNDLKYRLKGGSQIIPLKIGALNQFLSVRALSDGAVDYKAVPYRKTDEAASGTYTVRTGGVERFNGTNARELISYLLELLRSESAAFAAYGYDFIATTLKEMNQRISLMEQKTKGYLDNTAETPNYIIVKPYEGRDMMYAEYWTTQAASANNLRAGTKLQQVKNLKVNQEFLFLLTTTTGGKNRLRPEERLSAFKYGIMTRNRIITKEDIRNFCFYELKGRLQKVTIERGFEVAAPSTEAFRRTIDVMLTPQETDPLDQTEWQLICEQLKSKLQTRSGMSNYYRVIVQQPTV